MDVKIQWQQGEFAARNQKGSVVKISDGSSDAITPMEALLMAVGSCSGIDVVSTLEKMRQPVNGLEIEVSGQRRQDHPKYFEKITVKYIIRGQVEEAKARRAIELSLGKYCSVSNALEPKAQVDYVLEILGETS